MILRNEKAKVVIELDGVSYTVQQITPREHSNLKKKLVKYVGPPGRRVAEVDDIELGFQVFKKMVVGWEGIEDGNGNALECNDKTKEQFFDYHPVKVGEVLSLANAAFDERSEDSEKN